MGGKFLVVGDAMIDTYVFVSSSRQAQEAPVPVWRTVSVEDRLGGAANVANNLKSLCGVSGSDVAISCLGGDDLEMEILRHKIRTRAFVYDLTMVKTRYVADGKIIFRNDFVDRFDDSRIEIHRLLFEPSIKRDCYDCVVVSDYDKGTVDRELFEMLLSMSPRPTIIVDSKRPDLSIFDGADVMKLNGDEYERTAGRYDGLFKRMIVTLGSSGARTFVDSRPKDVPVKCRQEVDVTGCGDTHTAAFAYEYARTGDFLGSVAFANDCAADVVTRLGTSVYSAS